MSISEIVGLQAIGETFSKLKVAMDALETDLARLREIERCARGLVRTAHPDPALWRAQKVVVNQWWNGLKRSLMSDPTTIPETGSGDPDFIALARHHREAELAAGVLAIIVGRLVDDPHGATTDHIFLSRARDALANWDAHQWPDEKPVGA